MALNVDGALFESTFASLKITASSRIGFDTSLTGSFPTLPYRPWFVAYRNSAWNTFSANAWNPLSLNATYQNNGSHYSTSTYRFTAPITGAYYFEHSAYGLKNPSTNSSSYTHPMFWVNGSSTLRMASQSTSYRLRSRTNFSSTYSWDTQINDILYLTSGDYVQVVIYCNGTQQWYGYYTHFTGFFIG